ncbi:MAG TPA: restriction endonuclease [Acidobacteriaceae bacterium]|jgi:hypothetical protein
MKRVFLSYSYDRDRILVDRLKLRMRENPQLEILDPMDLAAGHDWASEIGLQIKRANIVITFINAASATVFYETGMAIGAGKPVLIVGNDPESLPAELRLIPFVTLSGDIETDLISISDRLKRFSVEEEQPLSRYFSLQEKLETYHSDPAYFDAMSQMEFEELLIGWLKSFGFEAKRPDEPALYGVDLIAQSPYDRSTMVFEMKKFSRQSRVSIKDVMALFGAATLFKADAAVLITSSSFTAAAMEMAKDSQGPKLHLITMENLLQSPDPTLLLR